MAAICFSALALPQRLAAQVETPRIQLFAGYSRLQFDSKSLGFSGNTGLNGATGSVSFNLTPEFGVVGELGAQDGPNFRVRDWLVGPQVMYGKWGTLLFGHILFGKADTRVTTTIVETSNARAVVLGGGFDFPITHRLSVRVIQVDYFQTHVFGKDQNNLKFSTGVVFRWGELRKKRHQAP